MTTDLKINGLMVDAPKYSLATRTLVLQNIKDLRPWTYLPDDAERGTRFYDDNHIVWLLESNIPESNLKDEMNMWTLAALIEAGRSDYWYAHEKNWD